ncbi:hypothetical protein GCM10023115_32460 [Pontixanthobacter gangjinensis]|uniref:Uncharacterized protein n=1 Tax=Christiangramia aestuarii TaxID=1028746 RepID=A0A7K1LNU2_9FLAO|nr:DUF6090 family protein [Christiangramia aestuarii]MUP42472.1 hypothetical protein [Christiangramia aestuarii]
MLRFFRKIRQRLLAENKFRKYLLYALGEITLVVIGILIALAINNWKEDRIVEKREEFYLQGLKDEFEQNRIKLQNLIEVNRLNYQNSKKIASLIGNSEDLENEEQLSEMLYNSFSYEIAYNPNNSLLNELINSGRLEDISSAELRKHLTAWDSYILSLRNQENALKAQREEVVNLFRKENASIRTILDQTGVSSREMGLEKSNSEFSNLELIESREFENNLLIFILTGIATENAQYKPLMQEIDLILSLLEEQMNS